MTEFRESETLELKKSTSKLKEAIISMVAILNKHGKGELFFGMGDDGRVVGQDVSEKTIRKVSSAISDNIEPRLYPEISRPVFDSKNCIKVEFRGRDAPYFAYGRAFIRVGDEDRKLSARELENLILEKNKEKLRWDADICAKAKLSDISEGKLRSFLEESGKKFGGIANSLSKLNLMMDEKILNAGVILFGKNPEFFFPNARLRCAVFGTTDSSMIIDMQDFRGDLFYLIDEAEKYILKNIHVGMRLEGLKRVDVPEINKEAFREGIINAFCHRDYWKYDSVNIAVFKDRLEIRSPGLLYGGLTIERIRAENVSERRNELIAEMFHMVHYVEKWGRGISLILSREPDTIFKEVGRQFITVFKRKDALEGEGVSEGVSEGVNLLLEYIGNKPGGRVPHFEKALHVPAKTIERWLKKLRDENRIEFRGSPKTGGYYAKKPPEKLG